ncbi:SARP family transcriptional regulator [Streptomyces albiflavescens]|uniref:SARP family transcriptional regulator n=1 Tax=Streptomyces albiflavescens TaxID=1623582 RepID=A0A917YET2_9ACTN|nr:BTAD domain-containing putative transcriptional regulator [Streptomyces albiflavescens]GGN94935.1 SARP family transcriptional regulator [Streptomyces albiflavescens]
MRFAVLGPVRAWRGDTELELGPPKQRGLLALLLIQSGHPVAVQEIVDALWGQNPPDSAVNVVQRHIGALRRLFEPGLPARGTSRWLVRRSGGYHLDVDPDSLDLLQFRAMRQEAGRLAESGKSAEATELLIQALALRRGPAAMGIPPEVRAHPGFTAVDREHLFAVKEAADYALDAGPGLSARVLVTLRQAAAQHSLDEVLQAKLVVLLAATGHQAEALEAYRTVRTRLADELGLDPGPELRAAQQQVLRQTVAVGPAPSAAEGAGFAGAGEQAGEPDDAAVRSQQDITITALTARPAQLPVDFAAFAGRSCELTSLHALLPPTGETPSAVLISAIGGMAGVGKTTLAVHWAHQVADRFPDGQLYINLRGFHPTGPMVSPAEAIRSFLDAFGVAAHRIPTCLDAQAALYRTLLADRRVLVVLDNAQDSEHVRPLLPASPGCLVIVTSRNQLHGLVAGEGAHSVTLDLLSEADALEFLSRRLGADRVARESRAAGEIVALCGRLPLALAIVSARAAVNPAFSLSSIAAELREGQGSLDAFAGEAPLADMRSVFSWSYSALTPEAARLFRLLGMHPGPDSSITAVASLAGRQPNQVRPLLTELVRAHLVSETEPGRFGCHELLRAYGAELGQAQGTAGELNEARCRMLDHYLHSAQAADRALAPTRERIELRPPAAHVTVERFADHRSAVEWWDKERPVLLAAVDQEARHGSGEHGWQLAATLESYLDRSGRWQEQLAAQTAATTMAQRLGDVRGQAHAHRALGFVSGRLERWDDARVHLWRSLELFGEIGDPAGQARAHRYLAFLANRRKRHEKALDHYLHAQTLYRSTGLRCGEASVSNEVGWTYILMGKYDNALDECGRALAIHQEIGDCNGEAAAWDSLGYAHHHLHDHEKALTCYAHALERYREIRDRYLEADTLVHIGDTHHAGGHHSRAALAWRQALEILLEIGHPDATHVRGKLESLDAPR